MSFGIIGCGEVSARHIEAINKLGGELVAACDIDLDKAAGLAPYVTNDYKHLLRLPEVEVISICTPNVLHVPMAMDAIEAGKKVILEKPVATTLSDAYALARHPLSSNITVCYQRRHNQQAQDIKRYIEMTPENPPVKVNAQVYVRRDPDYWKTWRSDPVISGGANLINIDIHYFDLLQWWLGDKYEIKFAKTAQRGGIDQATFAQLDFDGVEVEFFGSALHSKRFVDMTVSFADGKTMTYNKDDGTHLDIYSRYLLYGLPISVEEAIKSLKIVLDIYEFDKS